MNDLAYLARSRATAIWFVLVAATAASWWFGVHDVPGLDHTEGAVGALVMVIAFIKVRFIILHFMEVRGAPTSLRLILEIYCAAVLTTVVTLLLVT